MIASRSKTVKPTRLDEAAVAFITAAQKISPSVIASAAEHIRLRNRFFLYPRLHPRQEQVGRQRQQESDREIVAVAVAFRAQAAQAHEYLAAQKQFGKVVLKIP